MKRRTAATLLAYLLLGAGLAGQGFSIASDPPDFDREGLARIETPPLGLPPVPIPAENPPTVEKIALGRKLFFDRRLSFNRTMSCGMCHVPEQGFTNNELATPIGVGGRSLRRNAPTTLNAAYVRHLFHDGRETSLETQVASPLLDKSEMANPSFGYVLARIADLADYDGLFEEAFGGPATIDRIGMAIASWQRTMLAGDAPFDRWHFGGDESAIGAEAKRGFELFVGDAGCVRCHLVGGTDALFTDNLFHDTGIGYLSDAERDRLDLPVQVEISPGVRVPLERSVVRSVGNPKLPDMGRFEVTLQPEDQWRFRTPSLRNVEVTAPYMHDGSLRTLEDVVRFYVLGGVPHPGIDPLMGPIDLDPLEQAALVAFLRSLTSSDLEILRADARSVAVGN